MLRPISSVERLSAILLLLMSLGVGSLFPAVAGANPVSLNGKKILWVNSYHQGYPWSDGTERGIRNTLAGTAIRLEVVHMDCKRKSSPEAQLAAGLLVRKRAESLRPDLIIASDDPAQAYAVVPHLLNKSIPLVFTGVNWDASFYGYPRPGVTGMIEVDALETLVRHMKSMAKGNRFALIGSDDVSEQKNIEHYIAQKHLFQTVPIVAKVTSYEEFQKKFLEIQQNSDAIILMNSTTLPGWEKEKARVWIENNTRIVTGTHNEWMTHFALISVAKVPEEQGIFAGKTAIRILQGSKPESIPLVTNEQHRLYLNKSLADRLRIIFPLPLLRASSAAPVAP